MNDNVVAILLFFGFLLALHPLITFFDFLTKQFGEKIMNPIWRVFVVVWMVSGFIVLIFYPMLSPFKEKVPNREMNFTVDGGQYQDGTYCAQIDYYNPNTGTSSTYTLTVIVQDNELIQINWPNRGWLDTDHFYGADIDENGYTSFTSDKGYEYEVSIVGNDANCFTSVPTAKQCHGLTEDGDICQNITDNPNGLCWQHQDQE